MVKRIGIGFLPVVEQPQDGLKMRRLE